VLDAAMRRPRGPRPHLGRSRTNPAVSGSAPPAGVGGLRRPPRPCPIPPGSRVRAGRAATSAVSTSKHGKAKVRGRPRPRRPSRLAVRRRRLTPDRAPAATFAPPSARGPPPVTNARPRPPPTLGRSRLSGASACSASRPMSSELSNNCVICYLVTFNPKVTVTNPFDGTRPITSSGSGCARARAGSRRYRWNPARRGRVLDVPRRFCDHLHEASRNRDGTCLTQRLRALQEEGLVAAGGPTHAGRRATATSFILSGRSCCALGCCRRSAATAAMAAAAAARVRDPRSRRPGIARPATSWARRPSAGEELHFA